MNFKKAICRVLFWIAAALVFNLGIYCWLGKEKAMEFFGGYLLEQSLSVDNLFLFLIVFSSFGIPLSHQSKVLNYGIFGAIVLRLVFVVLGVAIVTKMHWVIYVFGGILVISGIRILFQKTEKKDYRNSGIVRLLGRVIPVTPDFIGTRFFVNQGGLFATPLLVVLVLIEGSDLIFAVDSIPAIFSITTDPFIVYSSNIFAILGLRSMYFLLDRLHQIFRFMKYGIGLILIFTGIKMTGTLFGLNISLQASIFTILFLLIACIGASLLVKKELKGGKLGF